MEDLIKKSYHNLFVSSIFHTLVYCLRRELKNCSSVLDLGCGPNSPIKHTDVPFSVGVEAYKPYFEESKKKRLHNRYILEDITKVKFRPGSFDAVMMIDVIEHLQKKEGNELLKKAEIWAKKKVIVSTPNGFLPQKNIDGNPLQLHHSGWLIKDMRKLGYKAYGMAGWKFLRKENDSKGINQEGDIFSTIRFPPRVFWLIISELTQLVTYFFPSLAFSVFYVKNVEDS